MADHDYHVNLPGGLLLTVKIKNDPITIDFTSTSGKKMTFHYTGNPGRTATVTPGTGTHIGRVPATHALADGTTLSRTTAFTGAETIEYIDPGGSRMD